MSDTAKPLNLMQRINRVRKAVDYIRKDKSVSTGQSGSYQAVTHDMVTAMIRDHLVAQGVVVLPSLVSSKMSEPAQLDPAKINRQWLYQATYDFVFVNEDNPADTCTVRIEAHANDNADKAPGKALSYAKKYAMLKVFEIETGEDDESRVPEAFDQALLEKMAACTTLADLKAAYDEALAAAGKDRDAVKDINAMKESRVKAINANTPRSEDTFDKAVKAIIAGTFTIEGLKDRPLTERQKQILADLEAAKQ